MRFDAMVLTLVLGKLGAGTALFALLQKTGEIRKSFFGFMSLLAAASLFLAWAPMIGRPKEFILLLAATIPALAAWHCFEGENAVWGKRSLSAALLLSGSGLAWHALFSASKPEDAAMASANLFFGTLLFGWAVGAMILGHWYLIMQGLSFHYLQRATSRLMMVIGIRVAFFILGWIYLSHLLPVQSDPLLLSIRGIWGLLVPAVFGYMAWRCAAIGSNQAATGLLYLVVVAVLIGEILASPLGF